MSTTVPLERHQRRLPLRLLAAVGGLAIAAALTVAIVADDDSSPAPRPASTATTVDTNPEHDPLISRYGQPEIDPQHDPLISRYGQP
jgi:hypothetical protein